MRIPKNDQSKSLTTNINSSIILKSTNSFASTVHAIQIRNEKYHQVQIGSLFDTLLKCIAPFPLRVTGLNQISSCYPGMDKACSEIAF